MDKQSQKDTNDGLHESVARYRAFFENGVDGIVILNPDSGQILEFNDRACRQLGYTREEFSQLSVQDIEVCESPEDVKNHIQNILCKGSDDFITKHRTKDGEIRDIRVIVQVLSIGGRQEYHCVWRDISEQRRAEEALHKEMEFTEAVLDSQNDMLILFELSSGKSLRWNRAFKEISGYSDDEISGMKAPDSYFSSEDLIRGKAAIEEVLQRGKATVQLNFICKNGKTVPIEYSGSLMKGPEEATNYFIAIGRDLTDRMVADEKLRESETTFSSVFMASPMGIHLYELDDDGQLIFTGANPAADKLTDIDNTPRIGLEIEEAFPSLIGTGIPDHYRKAARTGESWYTEQVDYQHGGIAGAFEVYCFQMSPGKVAVLFNNITERKRVEEALRMSQAQLSNALSITHAGHWEYDVINNSFTLNDNLYQVFHTTAEESGGYHMTAQEFTQRFCHPDDRQHVKEIIFKAMESEDVNFSHYFEHRVLFTDGSIGHVAVRFFIVKDSNGRTVKLYGANQDITERKLGEEERERLNEQLLQAQKMESIGRLAGGVAHDFNNMLGVILGHVEMALEEVGTSTELHADLTEIQKAAERSTELTRQLLAFARKQTVAPKILDLNSTIEGMLKMLRRLIGEDINLIWKPADTLWTVQLDPSQLNQILANLCVNARDAISSVGTLIIETSNRKIDEDYCLEHPQFELGDYVRIDVSDNGSGMDNNTLELIFEPFFTTKGVGEGTGLGLATVYGIVKQNKGLIDVYSEVGNGTTFSIYLPRNKPAVKPLPAVEAVHLESQGNETILLVEDQKSLLKMVTTMLESLGYNVLSSSTPGEAMHLARECVDNIHLLITDVVMPEMNGRDLAKNLLSLHPDIKRLFMSGYTANVIAHHGVLEEGVNFIQKPFSKKELSNKVREILDNQST